MAYEKTTWIDHVVEYPNRYNLVTNADGSVTLTIQPGAIVQQGTSLSSTNLNKIENALSTAFDFAEGNEETVKNLTKNVIGLALEVETIKNAQLSGVDANIFVEQFVNLDDVTLTSGLFDVTGQKIYLA